MMKITYIKIFGHILSALWQVTIYFPKSNQDKKNQMIQKWCRQLLKILEVDLNISDFDFPKFQGVLFASNHISWLDIMVINAVMPVRFVAKSEVKSWPVVGYLADQLNTLYIHRSSRGDVRGMVEQLVEALQNGQKICIFPEGTSSDGLQVLEFRPNLFEAVIASRAICLPMALVYTETQTGKPSTAPAYCGELTLIDSIRNLVRNAPISVTLSVAEIDRYFGTRKDLSEMVRNKVVEMHQLNSCVSQA